MANEEEHMAEATNREENSNGRGTKEAGIVFTGILLALILTGTLDAFFKNIPDYPSMTQLCRVLNSHPRWGLVVLFLQLVVFLFTVIRFYWGSYRYHEGVQKEEGDRQWVVGLIGTVVLFSGFYVTGLTVRNSNLFYWSFAGAHFIDLLWFVPARMWEKRSEIRTIWNWYILFDMLTLFLLALTLAVGYKWPDTGTVCRIISLSAIFTIGVCDVVIFWRYYRGEKVWRKGWREKLPRL